MGFSIWYFPCFTFILIPCYCFSSDTPVAIKVIVTGAGSSVGYSVFKKILKRKGFMPIGLVADRKGYDALLRLGASKDQIKLGDIRNKDSIRGAFDDATKAVLCTSARPKKILFSRLFNTVNHVIGRGKISAIGSDLYYPAGETPYDIDFIGQKNVIDECLNAKVEHIVLLGNMGGYRGSKLNEVGRKAGDDPKIGNILKWKRAAERYLMKRCFFTIVHAGALTEEKGGIREIVWDMDDALLRTSFRRIPIDGAAEVLVQALLWKEAVGRSIDVASRPPGDGGAGPTKDWLRFWAIPGNCAYPADYESGGGGMDN